MKLTPSAVYNKLTEPDASGKNIFSYSGKITFDFGSIQTTIKQKDVVGNIIQEWMQSWLQKNNIEHSPNPNPQMPPDFYLDNDDKTQNLLEIKSFDASKNPNFDIADFKMYEKEIIKSPYMLNTDYLIFSYKMDDNGEVKIENLWLKKVWQITRPAKNWPLNLQVKNDVVHKIRPATWYSKRAIQPFKSLVDFLSAVEQTVYQNPDTHNESGQWKNNFLNSYRDFYQKPNFDFPRWDEIKDNYLIK